VWSAFPKVDLLRCSSILFTNLVQPLRKRLRSLELGRCVVPGLYPAADAKSRLGISTRVCSCAYMPIVCPFCQSNRGLICRLEHSSTSYLLFSSYISHRPLPNSISSALASLNGSRPVIRVFGPRGCGTEHYHRYRWSISKYVPQGAALLASG
jgi:hypothetical protein